MDEGRKRVLLIAAAILAARNLAQFDGPRQSAKFDAIITNALDTAERIMQAIDTRAALQRQAELSRMVR